MKEAASGGSSRNALDDAVNTECQPEEFITREGPLEFLLVSQVCKNGFVGFYRDG